MGQFMNKENEEEVAQAMLTKAVAEEVEIIHRRPTEEEVEVDIKNLLWYVGENADREGLLETPKRVRKAWDEMLAGYKAPSDETIMKTFEDGGEVYDQMVLVKDIKLQSFCEHHMIPFFGVCHIAYIPNKRIVGLSKLNRIVDKYMRRLQVQERLTGQIADAIEEALSPLGVAVMIEATHLCVCYRGIKDVTSKTRTTALHGAFRTNTDTREEFLDGCRD